MFSIGNTSDGYVVSVLRENSWFPLRNFGERQGDAIEFRYYDCPHLNESQIKMLIRNYDKDRKFIRIDSRHFKVQQ